MVSIVTRERGVLASVLCVVVLVLAACSGEGRQATAYSPPEGSLKLGETITIENPVGLRQIKNEVASCLGESVWNALGKRDFERVAHPNSLGQPASQGGRDRNR